MTALQSVHWRKLGLDEPTGARPLKIRRVEPPRPLNAAVQCPVSEARELVAAAAAATTAATAAALHEDRRLAAARYRREKRDDTTRALMSLRAEGSIRVLAGRTAALKRRLAGLAEVLI